MRDDLRETPATRHSYVHIAHTRYSHTCVITVTPPHVDSNILYSTLLLALLFGCVVYASATHLVCEDQTVEERKGKKRDKRKIQSLRKMDSRRKGKGKRKIQREER